MNPVRLVTFEGIDGSGKSTQARLALEYLRNWGISVELLAEPGGTPIGDNIRAVLLDAHREGASPDAVTEFLLFVASRVELCRRRLRPLLDAGTLVLMDRFSDSSLAYQGYGRGVDLDFIRMVNQVATGGLNPALTVLFDLPPEVSLTRLKGPGDRMERSGARFFEIVRRGYLELAAEDPQRWRVIDADRDQSAVAADVRRILDEFRASLVK